MLLLVAGGRGGGGGGGGWYLWTSDGVTGWVQHVSGLGTRQVRPVITLGPPACQ